MKNTTIGRISRFARCLLLGFAFMPPTAARAVAPDVSVAAITATPQTNFNGSVVVATYNGSWNPADYAVALEIGSASYEGVADAGQHTLTFSVPGSSAVAGGIYAGTITATERAQPAETHAIGARNLYQGAVVPGVSPTAWFTESPASSGMGTWSPDRAFSEGKIVFDDESDYSFTPNVASSGQFATLEMDVAFDAALDDTDGEETDAQASIRLVTVGAEDYRFAMLDGGAWKTNDAFVAALDTEYGIRMEFSYRGYPATVSYFVTTGGVTELLGSGAVSCGNKLAIERLTFDGCGSLMQMSGGNVADMADASLVKDADNMPHATVEAATMAGKTDLTLLWDMAWNPDPAVDGAWTIHEGGRNLYIDPSVTGVRVTKEGATYTVVANYYEVKNVLAGAGETKFMYLADALGSADETVTNLVLLRDVAADVALIRSLAIDFNGHGFAGGNVSLGAFDLDIAGGAAGWTAAASVPFAALSGSGTLRARSAAGFPLLLKDVAGFTGSLDMSVASGVGAVIGAGASFEMAHAGAGRIVLAADSSAAIAGGKSWTAAGGIYIDGSVGGSGTLASATAFGDGAELIGGGLSASAVPTFGDTLAVTLPGAVHGTALLTAPAMADPTTDVTANGETGCGLFYRDGALRLFRPSPLVFTVTSVTATPSTNFNGSTVVVAYSDYLPGSCEDIEVTLAVGGSEYVYQGVLAASGELTFNVPAGDAAAGDIEKAVISVSGTSEVGQPVVAYEGRKYLYQGAVTNLTTNAWFAVDADRLSADGAWSPEEPLADAGQIRFPSEEGTRDPVEYGFDPAVGQQGQVVVVETEVTFEGVLDDFPFDTSSMQGALRVVMVDEQNRLAALVDGAWVTNLTEEVDLLAAYTVRTTFDYSGYPSTVKYELKKGDVYEVIAGGTARTDKLELDSASFAGDGALVRMTGSNCAAQLDPSLVEGAEEPHAHYADIAAATQAGVTNLTLLWNTAWTPDAATDGAWTIHTGQYRLYLDPAEEGVWYRRSDGTYTVRANYFEAANVLVGAEGVTTNRLTYFTNAVARTDAAVTNLFLLHDVTLDAALAVGKTMAFDGDTNVLSGAGFDVAAGNEVIIRGGCIGIPPGSGTVSLAGGRFSEASKSAWQDSLPAGYTFAEMSVPVREGYRWQFIREDLAPKSGEVLLPVKDADGRSESIVLNGEWVEAVTKTDVPAEQSAALSVKQRNGLTRLDNEILGLEDLAGDIPVIQAHQADKPDVVTFSLGNVSQDAISASGAHVSYRVYSSRRPGGKDGEMRAQPNPAATTEMPLPASGVLYYTIEVDTGAVK